MAKISYRDPKTGETKTASSFKEVEQAVRDASKGTVTSPNTGGTGVKGTAGGKDVGSDGQSTKPYNDPRVDVTIRAAETHDNRNVAVGSKITIQGETYTVRAIDPKTGQVSATSDRRRPGDPGYYRGITSTDLIRAGYTSPIVSNIISQPGVVSQPGTVTAPGFQPVVAGTESTILDQLGGLGPVNELTDEFLAANPQYIPFAESASAEGRRRLFEQVLSTPSIGGANPLVQDFLLSLFTPLSNAYEVLRQLPAEAGGIPQVGASGSSIPLQQSFLQFLQQGGIRGPQQVGQQVTRTLQGLASNPAWLEQARLLFGSPQDVLSLIPSLVGGQFGLGAAGSNASDIVRRQLARMQADDPNRDIFGEFVRGTLNLGV